MHDDNDSGGEGDNSVIFVSKEMEIGIAPSARNEGNSEQRNSQRSSERGDHAKIFRERRSVKMPVVTFAVTKINQRGRKQSRFLRLSAVGIENVRQKTDVTSSIYEYTAIVKVVAVSVTKFSIYYENAKHPYTYISPLAIQIVSTITQRVKAVQNKEKMARFNAETFQLNLRHSNSHKEEITALVRNRNKANSILGVSDDEKLVAIVWKALTDPSSEEQNALKKFLDNDQSSVDIPTLAHNIRNFLDGIRYHLLQTRKTEFEALSESLEKSGQNKSAQQVVSRVIEATLENIVMAKFIPKVFAYHEKLCAKNDETFRKCRVLFKDHSQARLHISKEFQSKEGYSVSIANMNDLGNASKFFPYRFIVNLILLSLFKPCLLKYLREYWTVLKASTRKLLLLQTKFLVKIRIEDEKKLSIILFS